MAERIKVENSLRELQFVTVTFSCEIKNRLPDLTETSFYRAMVELINNSVHHGEASTIRIHIYSKENTVYIDYLDDGKGFDMALLNRPAPGKC